MTHSSRLTNQQVFALLLAFVFALNGTQLFAGFGAAQGESGGGTPPVTVDWTSYTPSYNWTTNTSITGEYRVVDGGETLEIRVRVSITGAPTMISNLTIGLPGGYSAKADGINGYMIGMCNCFDSDAGSGVQNWVATMCYVNGSNELVLFAPSASVIGGVSGSGITTTAPFTFANGDSISMTWRIPLA